MTFRTAFVLGGANTVFDDIEAAYALTTPHVVIAINDIGAKHEKIDHWVSMHPKKIPQWLERRRTNGFEDPQCFWTSHDRGRPSTINWRTIPNTKGGSGLLAVYVARHLDCTKIILCGVPMDKRYNHFFDTRVWNECNIYRAVWENNGSLIRKDDVRSLSGWTKKQFGEPSSEWLIQDPPSSRAPVQASS